MVRAIEDLKSEGYLEGVQGSGTYVCKAVPDTFWKPPLQNGAGHSGLQIGETVGTVSEYAKRLRSYSHFTNSSSRTFRTNLPAVELFPLSLWTTIVARRMRLLSQRQLISCAPSGFEPLRRSIAQYLRVSRGVNCAEDQVLVVSGIQEALDLTARLIINPGDVVGIEDPGYQVAYRVFEAAGAVLSSLRIDDSGAMAPNSSTRTLRLLYLTPAHQFPTGTTMTAARRFELLAFAKAAKAYVFEDDFDSEFRYSGSPLPALQGLDREGKVIFAGSFNKVLFPALRLGYMVLPKHLVESFTLMKAMVSRHHSVIDQCALHDFIEMGHFAVHLRKMRKIYSERLHILLELADRRLSRFMSMSNIEAGLQTIAWLRPGLDAGRVTEGAAKLGVDVVPLSRYSYRLPLPEGLQIGFAAVDRAAIEHGIQVLAEVCRELTQSQGVASPGKACAR